MNDLYDRLPTLRKLHPEWSNLANDAFLQIVSLQMDNTGLRKALEQNAIDRLTLAEEIARWKHVASGHARQVQEGAQERNRFREALRIIAGEQQCLDNLMSNGDVARAALYPKEKA